MGVTSKQDGSEARFIDVEMRDQTVISFSKKLGPYLALLALVVIGVILNLLTARYPVLTWVAVAISSIFALCGLMAIGLAIMAFSIIVSRDDGNRRVNVARCVGLAGVGFLCSTPVVFLFVAGAF